MNTNCLDGMRCPNPECGSEEPFRIVGTASFLLYDDGCEDFEGVSWEQDSTATCVMCNHHGPVAEFWAAATINQEETT